MATSADTGTAGMSKDSEPEIDDLLMHLDLRDDKLDDVVISAEEVNEYRNGAMDGDWEGPYHEDLQR